MQPPHQDNICVAAVIIAFQPDKAVLGQLMASILPQVQRLIIINNGNPEDIEPPHAPDKTQVISFGLNLGIGEAIACAVTEAKVKGCNFLLTLDQDSIPAPDMVEKLIKGYQRLSLQGRPVGGVGPQHIDRRSGYPSPFTAPIDKRSWLRNKIKPEPNQCVAVDHLITSGLLAPMSTYDAVGLPRADLFVDYVDIEWCLRARYHGFNLYGVGGAFLYHSIGDSYIQFRGRQLPVHSPLRNYYLLRNGVYLQRLSYIPLIWRLSDAWQLVKKFVFFLIFLDQRRTRLQMMLAGIRDGLQRRLGRYDENR
ncbi:MAG: glycosyltransferase family 2 protein [Pseudomonadota bacterium]|jgi:rhamnosyltransferase